jgi:hypothetical protein
MNGDNGLGNQYSQLTGHIGRPVVAERSRSMGDFGLVEQCEQQNKEARNGSLN